jgi:para-nitrobenzyl esterase
MRRAQALAAALLASLSLACAAGTTQRPLVPWSSVAVSGLRGDGVDRFLGLRYGAAPTGAARWSLPAAPAPLPANSVHDGTVPAPRCPQSAAGLAARDESEDCLFLNVYRPSTPARAPRAVLVYVHGGGATSGSANDHDGSALAREGDIIVVTINYRLGALGFMNSALLAAEGADRQAGNYALHDIKLALEWVRDAIGRFGGDPARVTLAGESAGGTLVCPLLAWPQVQGLFRAAIISSDDCLHDVDRLPQARARAAALAARLDCADSACLRRRSPAALLAAGGFAAPSIAADGIVRDYPAARIASGQWHPIPLLIGANRDEGRIAARGFFKYTDSQYQAWLGGLLSPAAHATVARAYQDDHADAPLASAYRASAIITDSGMRGFGGCSVARLVQAAARVAPVYFYQFEDRGGAPADPSQFAFGAAHAAELAYLWPGAAFAQQRARLDPAQRRLAATMRAYWAAFVRDGRPTGAQLPAWPAMNGAGAQYLALDPARTRAEPLARYRQQHRCALWDSLPIIMERGEAAL